MGDNGRVEHSRFEYQCRRCGAVWPADPKWRPLPYIAKLMTNINYTDEQLDYFDQQSERQLTTRDHAFRHLRANLYAWHRCPDEGFGFSVLIGASKPILMALTDEEKDAKKD